MKTLARILLCASTALVAACGDNGETGLILATSIDFAYGTPPAACVCDPGSSIIISHAYADPAGTAAFGQCLHVNSQLTASPSGANTNDVFIEEIHVSYEGIGGDLSSVPEQIFPVSAYLPAGGTAAFFAPMIPQTLLATVLGVPSARVNIQVVGHTAAGHSITSTELGAVVSPIAASTPATNVCVAK